MKLSPSTAVTQISASLQSIDCTKLIGESLPIGPLRAVISRLSSLFSYVLNAG
ncbi:hypothetical protein [Peribacillus asahii]|uniref:hypothetical protein n=1 Tax=Peribacillus asahii TaxID=228899 RepID=UPI00207AFDC7|nr:hypothetical protein [Peribacillus asahii]USK59468.1 hypothetical protein LIT37_20240 [Peribacillus asahii]